MSELELAEAFDKGVLSAQATTIALIKKAIAKNANTQVHFALCDLLEKVEGMSK